MASGGQIITSEVQGRSITLSWETISQSIEGNYSDISWSLHASGSATGAVEACLFYATVNEEVVCNSSARMSLLPDTEIATGTIRIYHNSWGHKTFYMLCRAGIASDIVNVSVGGYFSPDSIPRASAVSASNTELGVETTIGISRTSSSFTHTLTYSFGEATGTIVTETIYTTANWTPPLELGSQIPNSTSGTCTISCYTYNGDTYIGCTTCTIQLSVPDTAKPTIGSLTAERIDGTVPSSWGIFVHNKSKALITINNPSGSCGSTIKSYSISGGGYFGTAETLTTGFLNNSGNISFKATVTDSRGRVSDEATVTILVYPYSAPYFMEYSCYRSTNSGTESSSGTYVRSLVKYGYYACSGNNPLTKATYYRAVGTTAWINAGVSFSSGTPFVFGSGNISTEKSYEIKYVLTDAFTSVSVIDTVSTAAVIMDFKSGGMGLAVGKVSETDNCFEVSEDWDVKVYGMMLNAYIQSIAPKIVFAECPTAVDVVEKVATTTDNFVLKKGAMAVVKFTYANTATQAKLNINGTGAKHILSYGNYLPPSNIWKPGQSVIFIYDGSYYIGLSMSAANTSYFGLTMLSNNINSTAQDRAATSYAVKLAYDRSSWNSISLSTPLSPIYGGTGSNNIAAARSNLGIKATSVFAGSMVTGSTTIATGYKFYIVMGVPAASNPRSTIVIPANSISSTATTYKLCSETDYYTFNMSLSDGSILVAFNARSSTGYIQYIYGVN